MRDCLAMNKKACERGLKVCFVDAFVYRSTKVSDLSEFRTPCIHACFLAVSCIFPWA